MHCFDSEFSTQNHDVMETYYATFGICVTELMYTSFFLCIAKILLTRVIGKAQSYAHPLQLYCSGRECELDLIDSGYGPVSLS
jgi:hypothetical protein